MFEHPGRSTMGASVFIAKRGGTIVTCAATSRLHDRVRQPAPLDEAEAHRVVSHFANYQEAWDMNRLIDQGAHPARHVGGLRARAGRRGRPRRPPQRGRGQARRAAAWPPRRASASPTPRSASAIGEDKITLFQRHARGERGATMPMSETPRDAPDRDRPRRHRGPRPRGRDRLLPARPSAPRSHHREVVETRRRRGGAHQGGRLLHPAHRRHPPRLADRQGRSRSGARACTTSATASTTARPRSTPWWRPAPRRSTRPPGPARGAPPWRSSTPRALRHAHRARPGVARPPSADPAPRAGPAVVGCAPTDSERGQ